jgi:ABC-type transport system involved in multi-copper enzyme maturation permease subunit
MSAVTTSTTVGRTSLHTATPSFFGLVSGELFKIRKQWTTWIMLGVLVCVMALPNLVLMSVSNLKTRITTLPLDVLYRVTGIDLPLMRIFLGFFLLILTARVFGLEYQLGTIRIILGRGVGRLQLLSAKLLAVVLVALAVFVASLLYEILWSCIVFLSLAGNLSVLNAATSTFWSDTGMFMVTVLISMGVTILLAMAVTTVGRSLSFGLSFALSWFAVDNFGVIIMALAFRLTGNDFWQNVTAYFLGPNLNVMQGVVVGSHPSPVGITPSVPVDSTHTLVVTLVYSLIFAVTAVVLTWRRDVKE